MSRRLRALAGSALLIGGLTLYAALAAGLASTLYERSVWVQTPVYLVLGLAWIPLARPVIVWITLGRWRVRPARDEPGGR